MIKEKVKMTTNPVAWRGGKITKYQTIIEYKVSDKRTIRILGDPKPSKKAAVDALYDEFMMWQTSVAYFNEFLNNHSDEEEE